MATYKITNITNLLGKRDRNYNLNQKIEYIDGMMKKNIIIEPTKTVYLSVTKLPISVHKLRMTNLITVVEVDAKQVNDMLKQDKKENISVEKQNDILEEKAQISNVGKRKVKKETEV